VAVEEIVEAAEEVVGKAVTAENAVVIETV
jgi:hypothetical protein